MKQIITVFLTIFLFINCCSIGHAEASKKLTNTGAAREMQTILVTYIKSFSEAAVKNIEIEFPEATYVWNYLHDLGYSDSISAAIIGNMMVECGGYTLDLQTTIESKTHYGICQWSKKYYPDVIDCSLESQCDFLRDTIQDEINTFGSKYLTGFNYKNFLEMTNERDAALAFAKSYERCGSGSYELRQDCAEIALEYFLG